MLTYIATLLVALGSTAQEQPSLQQPPTFRARTELVQVPVIVHKSGAHVAGLNKSTFTVFEDGAKREIAFFEEIHPSPPVSLAANTFNNVSAVSEPRRLTMVLLDLLNTSFSDQVEARRELVEQLTHIEVGGDPIGLFVLNSRGLIVVHDFTTDTAALAAALKQVRFEIHGVTSESPVPGTTPQTGSLTSSHRRRVRRHGQAGKNDASLNSRKKYLTA